MKKIIFLAAIATCMIFTFSSCNEETVSPHESHEFKHFSDNMRELWSDHAFWTRNVITNIIDGLPGTAEAVDRLLKNQEDIGDAIKPYYGDAGGNALTVLLKEHITIAADLLTAAKNSETEAFNAANTAWYANADEIASFLNAANPQYFPLDDWKTMMKDHLDLTLEEAVARLNGDYAADVVAFDKVYNELMMMSDMLAEGIAQQFPDKF